MADAGLLVSWGETYPGREEQAARLWNESNAWYASLLEDGRIGRFEPFVVGAHGAGLRGFVIIGGTEEQIGALRFDDEFVSYVIRSQFCSTDVGVTPLFYGEFLDHIMERWEHEVSALA